MAPDRIAPVAVKHKQGTAQLGTTSVVPCEPRPPEVSPPCTAPGGRSASPLRERSGCEDRRASPSTLLLACQSEVRPHPWGHTWTTLRMGAQAFPGLRIRSKSVKKTFPKLFHWRALSACRACEKSVHCWDLCDRGAGGWSRGLKLPLQASPPLSCPGWELQPSPFPCVLSWGLTAVPQPQLQPVEGAVAAP